ncbi:MAG: DUF4142 domain-containing protein [Acidobacteria bacterium]|nr:DUF4142 domain-containing protein [Acidobacteriota bacterium]
MIRQITCLAAGVLLFGLATARAEDATAQDRSFVEEAARGGMKEVHMGKLGLQKAHSFRVKAFAKRLVDDHTKANMELTAYAKRKGISLPADDPNVATSTVLASMSGNEFDQAFTKAMIDDHKHDIEFFEKAASASDDTELKTWAANKLLALRSHLQAAQDLLK